MYTPQDKLLHWKLAILFHPFHKIKLHENDLHLHIILQMRHGLYIKKREERWHAKEAWPTVSKREKMACQRNTTKKMDTKVQEKIRERNNIAMFSSHSNKGEGDSCNEPFILIIHHPCSTHRHNLDQLVIWAIGIFVHQTYAD